MSDSPSSAEIDASHLQSVNGRKLFWLLRRVRFQPTKSAGRRPMGPPNLWAARHCEHGQPFAHDLETFLISLSACYLPPAQYHQVALVRVPQSRNLPSAPGVWAPGSQS